jgi:beta-lactamase class A
MNSAAVETACGARRRFLAGLTAGAGLGLLAATPLAALARDAGEEDLETRVNEYVRGLRRRGTIPDDERTSWSVYDFTGREKLVSINEDVPRQAASMIKPFVAQAFFYLVRDSGGRFRYTHRDRRRMEAMIRRSSNSATNRLIARIGRHLGGSGPAEIETILKRNAPGIFRQTRVVETIPPGGRTYRNRASAHDYSRFLYATWHESLPYSAEIKDLMSLPNNDRIYHGVPSIPAPAAVYDKTGTTARLCGNMGIIEVPGRNGRSYPYTLIGIIEKDTRARNLTHWTASRGRVIRNVSAMVYGEMKRRYRLG